MHKFKLVTEDLTSTLDINELSIVNKLTKKVQITNENLNINDSELTVNFQIEDEQIVIYFQLKNNELIVIDTESISSKKYELHLLKIAALTYFNNLNDGYYINKNSNYIVNNKKISDLTSKLLNSKYNNPNYNLEIHVVDFKTNTIKLKISDNNSSSYTIKDVFKFVKNIEHNLTDNYNTLKVEHDINLFDKKTLKIISLIKEYYKIKYDDILTSLSRETSNYFLISNEKMYELLMDNEILFYNGKKYTVLKNDNKLQISASEYEDMYIVKCEELYYNTEKFYIKFHNNKLIFNVYIDENSYHITKTLNKSQVLNLSELYDFYCLIANDNKEDIDFKIDLSVFENKHISPVKIKLIKDKDDIVLEILQDEKYIVDKSKISLINNLLDGFEKINSYKYVIKESLIYTFLKHIIDLLSEYVDEIIYDEETKKIKLTEEPILNIKAENYGSSLNIKFLNPSLTEKQIDYILTTNDKYYVIGNTYVDIESEQNTALKQFIKANDIKENNQQINGYNKLYLHNLKKVINVDSEDITPVKVENYNILKYELRDYQKQGLDFLLKLNKYQINGILADDMGLGKTIQVISLLNYIKSDIPHLIIVPSSLIYNWKSEIEKFSPNLSIYVYSGKNRDVTKIKTHDIIITTFDTTRIDVSILKKLNFEYVIIDEAQYIKNYKSQISQSVRKLKSNHKLCLTGTPIENNISELWSLIDYLNPSYLNTLNNFNKTYSDPTMLNELKQKISPIILRRTKSEVLKELPEKLIFTIKVEMTTLQKALYDNTLIELQNNLKDSNNQIEMLSYITKLRQICTNPSFIDNNYHEVPIKYEMLIDKICELKENKNKIVVFTQFTKNFEPLKELFRNNNITFYEISGSTPSKIRHTLVNNFNDDSTDLMLVSLKAGGSGLNIVGANTVIHLDPWWNYAVESQANDRVHRIGQTKEVNVYKFITSNSIEEAIENMQKNKHKLSTDILDFEQNILSLSNDEILNLISSH